VHSRKRARAHNSKILWRADAILPATAKLKVIENRIEISSENKHDNMRTLAMVSEALPKNTTRMKLDARLWNSL